MSDSDSEEVPPTPIDKTCAGQRSCDSIRSVSATYRNSVPAAAANLRTAFLHESTDDSDDTFLNESSDDSDDTADLIAAAKTGAIARKRGKKVDVALGTSFCRICLCAAFARLYSRIHMSLFL
jgi:hypothetical protein